MAVVRTQEDPVDLAVEELTHLVTVMQQEMEQAIEVEITNHTQAVVAVALVEKALTNMEITKQDTVVEEHKTI